MDITIHSTFLPHDDPDAALAYARRDDAIRQAAAAGVSLDRIQELTGIAQTTIMRILGSPPRPTEAGRRR